MHLVTLRLPVRRNDGSPQPRTLFAEVRRELVDEAFDRGCWRRYREELEHRFKQDELMIRAAAIERV